MRRFFVGLAIIAMLGIVPCKARANDRQIIQQIVNALQEEKDSGNLKGFNIDLQVEDGTVYLKGHVSSKEQETLALDIARDVDGVRQVQNEIKIVASAETRLEAKSNASITKPAGRSSSTAGIIPALFSANSRRKSEENRDTTPAVAPSPESTNDSHALAEKIIARLKEEKDKGQLKGFSMDLEVEKGVASLTGKVATPEQQNLVLDIVRRVPGVTQVVNGLTITTQTKTPTQITNEVISRLQSKKDNGELKDFRVDVQTEDGIVWLSGTAVSDEQRQLILDVARRVPGVSKVVNDLAIVAESRDASETPVTFRTVSEGNRSSDSGLTQAANNESTSRTPQVLSDSPIGSSVSSSIPQPPSETGSTQGQKRPKIKYVWVPAQPGATQASAQAPLPFAPARPANYEEMGGAQGQPVPMNANMPGVGIGPARFDHPQMPQYAWPSYAAYPNYGAVSYPKQYSPMAWPYIGPFYPYPQVPLGWRKVTLEWDDGWWQLDFKSRK